MKAATGGDLRKRCSKNFANFTRKHLCWSKRCEKETPTRVSFYQIYKTIKNTYFKNICEKLLLFKLTFAFTTFFDACLVALVHRHLFHMFSYSCAYNSGVIFAFSIRHF